MVNQIKRAPEVKTSSVREVSRKEGKAQWCELKLRLENGSRIQIRSGGLVELALRELGARVTEVEFLEIDDVLKPPTPSPN